MTTLALAGLLLLPQSAPIHDLPITTRTFHDDGLRLTFTYPAGFIPQDMSAGIKTALKQAGPALLPDIPCIRTPLSAIRNGAPRQEELLLMLKLDFGCMGRQVGSGVLSGIAINSLRQGLAHIGVPTLSAPVHYFLGKYDAVLVQGLVPDRKDGNPGYAASACTFIVNTVVCWEVLTAYPSHIAPLLASAVTFGKAAPIPIVPAMLIVPPEGPAPSTPGPSTPAQPESRTP